MDLTWIGVWLMHDTEYVERERMYLIRLKAGFRNRLPPGQFPYPFWHDEAKWGVYQATNSVLLWVDPKTAQIAVAQFTTGAVAARFYRRSP
jgi:hypothetical protein